MSVPRLVHSVELSMSLETGWCSLLCLVDPASQASHGVLHMQQIRGPVAGGVFADTCGHHMYYLA